MNLREIFQVLVGTGAKIVVITDGKAGAQVTDGETIYYFPAYSAPAVDTLGAGDSFASAFVAGLIREGDIEFALKLASANASSVVRYFGAKPGLLSWDEACEIIQEKDSDDVYFVRRTALKGNDEG